MAARRRAIALCARKVDAAGAMRVVARGVSEDLAAFHGDLYHKQRDEGWRRDELVATREDEEAITGGELRVVRSEDAVTSGADSSGRAPPPAAAGAASPVDTGSTASSRLIVAEVRRERERGEAALRQAVAEAEARAVAAAEARAVAAREASIAALMTHAGMTRAAAEDALRGTQ
jgi:hypothetical protein